MFCVKCGEKLPDGSKFCPMCGSKVIESAVNNQIQIENQIDYQNVMTNQTEDQSAATAQIENLAVNKVDSQNPEINQVEYQNNILKKNEFAIEDNKQKGKRKKKLLVGGVSTIIALAVIFIVCYVFFAPEIKAYFLGTKNYYLLVEGKSFTKGFQDITNYSEEYPTKYNYEYDLSTKISGDIFGDSEYSEKIIDTLSKFRLNLKYDCNNENPKDSYSTLSFSGILKDEELGKVVVESADNKTKISFPELTDKTLASTEQEKSRKLKDAMSGDDAAFEEVFGLKREDFSKMVKKYKDIVFECIPNEQVEFNNDSEYRNLECNSITITLNEKDIAKIYKALAKEIKQDEDFKILLKSSRTLYNYVPNSENLSNTNEPSTDEINQEVDKICKDLEAAAEDMDKTNIGYSIYFNNDDTVIGRKLNDIDTKDYVEVASYTNSDKKDILLFNFKQGGESMQFSKESKVDNKNNIGTIALKINGKNILDAEYTSEINATVGGLKAFVGNIKGKFNFNTLLDSKYGLSDSSLSGIDFSLENKKSDNGDKLLGECKISTEVEGEKLELSLLATIKQSNSSLIEKPDISIVDSVDLKDKEALSELGSEIEQSLSEKIMEEISNIIIGY